LLQTVSFLRNVIGAGTVTQE